jgi:hypothetical protein
VHRRLRWVLLGLRVALLLRRRVELLLVGPLVLLIRLVMHGNNSSILRLLLHDLTLLFLNISLVVLLLCRLEQQSRRFLI